MDEPVAPDSLVARLNGVAEDLAEDPPTDAYWVSVVGDCVVPLLRRAAASVEQLKRERDRENVRADAYNEKFQKQCYVNDEELHRAMMAERKVRELESRLERITQVVEWALGQGDAFPDWPESVTITGNPKYWWRKELRERYEAARKG